MSKINRILICSLSIHIFSFIKFHSHVLLAYWYIRLHPNESIVYSEKLIFCNSVIKQYFKQDWIYSYLTVCDSYFWSSHFLLQSGKVEFLFFFPKMKVCGNPIVNKSTGTIFPTTVGYFVSLRQILSIFQIFSFCLS